MVSTSSEKYEESEYPVIIIFLSEPLIIDWTTFIVVLAFIENEDGAVTTRDTLSASCIFTASAMIAARSKHCEFDNSGKPLLIMGTALEVPFAISLLTVFKSISLFRFPPGIDHSPNP
jgi:hypothetical protein